MNSINKISFVSKNEKILLLIKKRAEIGFWDYQILGLFSFLLNRKNDYLLITNKRVVYSLNDELNKTINYKDFNNIKFNSLNDELSLRNEKDENKIINLKGLRLTYEEIQKIKKVLTNASFN
jgi:hypothetical protein